MDGYFVMILLIAAPFDVNADHYSVKFIFL